MIKQLHDDEENLFCASCHATEELDIKARKNKILCHRDRGTVTVVCSHALRVRTVTVTNMYKDVTVHVCHRDRTVTVVRTHIPQSL
jgi:hypothetical protein